jgi:hypothetical protein
MNKEQQMDNQVQRNIALISVMTAEMTMGQTRISSMKTE